MFNQSLDFPLPNAAIVSRPKSYICIFYGLEKVNSNKLMLFLMSTSKLPFDQNIKLFILPVVFSGIQYCNLKYPEIKCF